MQYLVLSLYAVVLFIFLSPNVLFRLPPKGDKWIVTFVHAFIFGFIFYLTEDWVFKSVKHSVVGQQHPRPHHSKPTQGPHLPVSPFSSSHY